MNNSGLPTRIFSQRYTAACFRTRYSATDASAWKCGTVPGEQAEYAAHNLIGGSEAFEAVPWFWSNQFDLTLQVAGLPGLCNEPVVRQRPDGVSLHFELTSDGRLVSVSEVGEGNSVAKDMRLGEILIISKTEYSK